MNDNPSAAEFQAIYRKLLVCKEIVYKNNYANCMTDDTGVLTVASSRSADKPTADYTFESGNLFEIEFDYYAAIDEEIGKFDQHLNSFIASTIESKLTETMKRCHKKECSQCIEVFNENDKVEDDFITKKNETSLTNKPCRSTVDLVKATNKILNLLVDQVVGLDVNVYVSTIKKVMSLLNIQELFKQSNFNTHSQKKCGLFTHKEEFICKIVSEYMKLKSQRIGSRITEQERGTYIRHNNKKRIHEAGQ